MESYTPTPHYIFNSLPKILGVFPFLLQSKKIFNPFCPFAPFINIRSKKMKSWTLRPPSLNKKNEVLPTFPAHHFSTFPILPPHSPPTFPTLPTTYPSIFLSHLPTSPLSHQQIKYSKITTLCPFCLSPHYFLQKAHNIRISKPAHLGPLALKPDLLAIRPLRHTKCKQPKTLISNSYSETLLAFYFAEAMQHKFVLEFHTYFLE